MRSERIYNRQKPCSLPGDLGQPDAAHPGRLRKLPRVLEAADVVALDDALNALAAIAERGAKAVELRYFGGLNQDETAEALGMSLRTVQRDWALAKAWLMREMRSGGEA